MVDIKTLQEEQLIFLPKGTKIFSTVNQLNFILDTYSIVRVKKWFDIKSVGSVFVKPQWKSINFLDMTCIFTDDGGDEWCVSPVDVYKHLLIHNTMILDDL